MKKVRKIGQFQIYTVMWLVAILVLIALLWQNLGGARIINYSGIVRLSLLHIYIHLFFIFQGGIAAAGENIIRVFSIIVGKSY